MSIRSRIGVIININKIIKKGILLEFDDTSNLDITYIAVLIQKVKLMYVFLPTGLETFSQLIYKDEQEQQVRHLSNYIICVSQNCPINRSIYFQI